MKKTIIAVATILVLIISIPFVVAEDNPLTSYLDRMEKLEKLDLILTYLEHYYDGEIDYDKLMEGAAAGMMYSLGDPYAYYSPVENHDAEIENLEGNYVGVGALLMVDVEGTKKAMVTRVFEGSSAQKSGIQKADIILAVDGTVMDDYDLSGTANAIRGEAGTQVTVTIMRGKELFDLTLPRAQTYSNMVDYQMLKGNIGYVTIYEFIKETADEFEAAINDLKSQGMEALLIDLRDNPGGELENSTTIADMLLPEGTIITVKSKAGADEARTSDANMLGLPLAVLINENSASASEIVSGAIKSYGVGTLVGKKTFGKGIVQYLLLLPEGDFINFTAASYYLPDGSSIHELGVEPDIEVTLEGSTLQYRRIYDEPFDTDAQMQKAIEVLIEKMGEAK